MFVGRGERCVATNSRCNMKRVPNTKVYRIALRPFWWPYVHFFLQYRIALRFGLCRIALQSEPYTHLFVSSTSTGQKGLGMSSWVPDSLSDGKGWVRISLGQGMRHFCSLWLSVNCFVICFSSLLVRTTCCSWKNVTATECFGNYHAVPLWRNLLSKHLEDWTSFGLLLSTL